MPGGVYDPRVPPLRPTRWDLGILLIIALFFAGIEQHDHKDEQDHHRTGIHNDLHCGNKFRTE